jgi:pilus assembly protein CpaE
MPRRALIVSGAAGPQDIANGVLQRYGFAPADSALGLPDAIARLRAEHFDLVVVPLQGIGAMELSALEREVRRGGQSLVIGTAAQADPELILRAMRSGIHEFLVYPPSPKDLSGAVDRLIRRTHAAGKSGTTIAVYSAKGGMGTTSIATNVAFALARLHPEGRVALVDLVAGGGDLRVMLDLKPQYDMGDLLRKMDRIDADLLHSILTPVSGGVWALPSSEDPETVDALDAAAVGSILEQLRLGYGYTVVDCEHTLSERTLAALDAADRIALVTQLNVPALRSTQRTLALCQRLGYPDDKVHVVVNRYQSSDVVTVQDAAKVLGREIFFRLPNDYRTSAAALTRGVPVAELDGSSALAMSYSTLAGRLNGSAEGNGTQAEASRGSRLGRFFSRGRKE